jgi:hypothetical protein
MPSKNPGLKAAAPRNVLVKPLKFEFKALFKALAKGVGRTAAGKWEELATDAVETLSAIGLATDPEELAFLLIRRSAAKALFELVGDSANLLPLDSKPAADALASQLEIARTRSHERSDWSATIQRCLDIWISSAEFHIDRRFLDRPADLPLVHDLENLLRFWLEGNNVPPSSAIAISQRFPAYFVYALN